MSAKGYVYQCVDSKEDKLSPNDRVHKFVFWKHKKIRIDKLLIIKDLYIGRMFAYCAVENAVMSYSPPEDFNEDHTQLKVSDIRVTTLTNAIKAINDFCENERRVEHGVYFDEKKKEELSIDNIYTDKDGNEFSFYIDDEGQSFSKCGVYRFYYVFSKDAKYWYNAEHVYCKDVEHWRNAEIGRIKLIKKGQRYPQLYPAPYKKCLDYESCCARIIAGNFYENEKNKDHCAEDESYGFEDEKKMKDSLRKEKKDMTATMKRVKVVPKSDKYTRDDIEQALNEAYDDYGYVLDFIREDGNYVYIYFKEKDI